MIATMNFNEWVELQENSEVIHPTDVQEGDIIINKPCAFFPKVLTRSGKAKEQEDKLSIGKMSLALALSSFRVIGTTPHEIKAKAIIHRNQRHANAKTRSFPHRMDNYLDVSDAFDDLGVKKIKYLLFDPTGRHRTTYVLWVASTKPKITNDELVALDDHLSKLRDEDVFETPPDDLIRILKDPNANSMAQDLGLKNVQRFIQAMVKDMEDSFCANQSESVKTWNDPSLGTNGFYFKTFQQSKTYQYLPARI